MWFRKKQTSAKPAPWPGVPRTLDGHSALAAVEQQISDGIVIRTAPYFDELAEQLGRAAGGNLTVQRTTDPGELAAILTGMNLTGLRSAAITGRIAGIADNLYAMAGSRLSCIINLTCLAIARQVRPSPAPVFSSCSPPTSRKSRTLTSSPTASRNCR